MIHVEIDKEIENNNRSYHVHLQSSHQHLLEEPWYDSQLLTCDVKQASVGKQVNSVMDCDSTIGNAS